MVQNFFEEYSSDRYILCRPILSTILSLPDYTQKINSNGQMLTLNWENKDWIGPWMTFYESPKIMVDTSSYMHFLLFRYLNWNQSWMRQTAEVYDIQIDSNLKWLWPFRLINSFPAYLHFLLKHSLSKLSSLIKAWICLIFPTFSGITESPLKSLSISRILTLLLFAISTKVLFEISFSTTTK